MWDYLVKKITPRGASRESSDIHPLRAPSGGHGVDPVRDQPHRGRGLDHRAGTKKRVIRCPVCHVEMENKWIGKVEVDQCPECLGVFLDRGELKAISGIERSSYQHERDSQPTLIYTPHGLTDHLKKDHG